jgi:long-chain fatty acid transport protein
MAILAHGAVRRGLAAPILAACLILGASAAARATGYFINQQSVTGLGRAFAGSVAAADDPSTVFYNPAGMIRLFAGAQNGIGFAGSVGANVIIPHSKLKNDGSTAATPGTLGVPTSYPGDNAKDPGDPTAVPNLYALQRLYEDRVVVGLGITEPFGLSGKYDDDWFGRYDSIETELTTINIGPVVAVRVNDYLSLGAGLDVQYAHSTLSSAIPNPLAPGGVSPATDGLFKAKGDDWSVGYNVGLLVAPPGASWRVGIHYRSQMDHKIEGSARTSGLTGPLAAANGEVDASAKSKLPAILSTGFAYALLRDREIGDRLTLYGDFTYFWWDVAKEARIKFDDGSPDAVRPANYRNTYAAGIGLDYRWNQQLTLRTGFRFDRTPTVDRYRDTSFADANRYWLAAGASYQVRHWLAVDLGLTHVFEDSTSVDVERQFFGGTGLDSTVRVKADVQSSVTTVGANVRVRF